MIQHYNSKSLALGIPGLLLQITPIFHDALPPHPEWVDILTIIATLSGWVLVSLGLCYYAQAKGYSKWLGLLGLLSCIAAWNARKHA